MHMIDNYPVYMTGFYMTVVCIKFMIAPFMWRELWLARRFSLLGLFSPVGNIRGFVGLVVVLG